MLVMGILNVTPDSFADGGRHNEFEAAVARGIEMIAEGVDIIDVGGESTRPGAERVSEEEEIARTIPVITELAKHGTTISIDTMRASTAAAAINAGALIINIMFNLTRIAQKHNNDEEISKNNKKIDDIKNRKFASGFFLCLKQALYFC